MLSKIFRSTSNQPWANSTNPMKSPMKCKTINPKSLNVNTRCGKLPIPFGSYNRAIISLRMLTYILIVPSMLRRCFAANWSWKFIYYFLHCGKFMRLMRFDRAGLIVSMNVDITLEPEEFLRCLLHIGVLKETQPAWVPIWQGSTIPSSSRGKNTPGYWDLLCLDKQITGPREDHLIGRGTEAWKAHLMSDLLGGKFFCVKASWAHIKRQHEGHYTTKPNNANVKNVVKLLAFSPEKSGTGYDISLGSEQMKYLMCIRNYHMTISTQGNQSAICSHGGPAANTNQ